MNYVGIDYHKKYSVVTAIDEMGPPDLPPHFAQFPVDKQHRNDILMLHQALQLGEEEYIHESGKEDDSYR